MSTSSLAGCHPLELSALAAVKTSPGFISETALGYLVEDVRSVPLGFDWFAFERGLGRVPQGIELQLSLSRPDGRSFVSSLPPDVPFHLVELMRSWAALTGHPAVRRAPNLVLEFDPDPGRATPLWGRCFCMLGLDSGPLPRGVNSLVAPLVSALAGGGAAHGMTAAAVEAERRLPGDACLMHVAHFDRGLGAQVRLHVGLRRDRLATTLRALGWSGDLRAVEEALHAFDIVGQSQVAVQLAVKDELLPRAGFELSVPPMAAGTAWSQAMRYMCELGLATELDAHAISCWEGRSTFYSADFPGHRLSAPLDITRRAHVKFVVDESGFVGAKGYLLGFPRFVPL